MSRLRIVKTKAGWRVGPWPVSFGWAFDLGRLRLCYWRKEMNR